MLTKISDISFSSIESIVSNFNPFLNESQLNQISIDLSEHMPDHEYDNDVIINLAGAFRDSREQYLEYFKKDTHIVCCESWNGKEDMYRKVHWNGNEFEILEIAAKDVIKES